MAVMKKYYVDLSFGPDRFALKQRLWPLVIPAVGTFGAWITGDLHSTVIVILITLAATPKICSAKPL